MNSETNVVRIGPPPPGQCMHGILRTPDGPMVGVQWPGEVNATALYPADAAALGRTLRENARGKLGKAIEAWAKTCEERRIELGIPVNGPPSPAQRAMFLAEMGGNLAAHLAERGEDVVGKTEPPAGGVIIGVIQFGDSYRVGVHAHGQEPKMMTPDQARELASAEAELGNAEGAETLRVAADECEALSRQPN